MEKEKVVSLFAKREKKDDEEKPAESTESFEETMKKNKANKDRVEQERLKANKSVLRSYRIKH